MKYRIVIIKTIRNNLFSENRFSLANGTVKFDGGCIN